MMDTRSQPCSHCGLPVPAKLAKEDSELQFCCSGCKTVYGVLHEHGLEGFYRVLDDDQRQQAYVTSRDYSELDNETFAEHHVRRLADGSLETELYLEGVRCAACVWLVEKLPSLDRGVMEVRLDLGRQLALLRWDPERTSLSAAARKLDSLGYPAHPFRGASRRELRRKEDRRLLIRLAVAGAVAGNVMLVAWAMYADAFGEMSAGTREFFRWVSMITSAPAVFYSGSGFLHGAWAGLKTRTLHMDLPIAIGLLTGFGWGAINTISGKGDIYFDSVTALVFLLLVGRILQQRQQRNAADAAELLFSLTPRTARVVLPDGSSSEIPVEAIEAGTHVEARAGDTIAVDGTIIEGRSQVDASLLSGESRPVGVKAGDAVHAGTLNLSARLLIEVEAAGEATRVGQLMQQVEEHARRRPPVVQLADRIAGYFVASTLSLAMLTTALWWSNGAGVAIEHAIALLIVTCPCALGLATPLAVAVAVGRAARAGVLIKGGDALQRLVRPGVMILDKTGTLTEGRLALQHWTASNELLDHVALLEAQSSHPIARAFAKRFNPATNLPDPQDVSETQGAGISGQVGDKRLKVGTAAYVAPDGLQEPFSSEMEVVLAAEQTPVVVSVDGQVAAVAGLGDPIRKDAKETLRALEARGWKIEVLSGDHPEIVKAVLRELGLAVEQGYGSATPEKKLERVEEARKHGPVVMVGDGVNDAAALSAASCGIAVHGGAEASLAAADVFLSKPGIAAVAQLVDGATTALRVIKQNVIFSLVYNVVGASLAIAGIITPIVAAVLMPLSSLTVVTASFRQRSFSTERDKRA
jgi:Cu2+-exporting ATPase